jgi:aspartyl-tRNA(Asn)/glutamyl-tRNA(Gln) amidotransferase subunit C
MLTDKDIQHIAELARLRVDKKEVGKLKKDLSSILDYINKLNKADTDKTEPLYQVTGLSNSLREDEPRGDFKVDDNLNEKLIEQAPHKKDRFVKVRSVLKK